MNYLILIFLLALTGCAGMSPAMVPTEEEFRNANYGDKPSPDQFEKAIKKWALYNLKDPDSLQLLDISKESIEGYITKCTEFTLVCDRRMFYFGHLVKIKLNAKNSNGGYTGFKDYTFLFRGNEITNYMSPE